MIEADNATQPAVSVLSTTGRRTGCGAVGTFRGSKEVVINGHPLGVGIGWLVALEARHGLLLLHTATKKNPVRKIERHMWRS
jgi:hypothetical protein